MKQIQRWLSYVIITSIFAALLVGCVRPSKQGKVWVPPVKAAGAPVIAPSTNITPTRTPFIPPTRIPGAPILTPTPDPPRLMPTPRTEVEQYTLKPGDSLGSIAQRYSVTINDLVLANQISNPDHIEVGQMLEIPLPREQESGPEFKIIPDSELVYGPVSAYFDLQSFIREQDGYLAAYSEDVEGQMLTGAQVVRRIAREYSVNPRLLLAILEYQSGWVSLSNPDEITLTYPVRLINEWRQGLYLQLAWTANALNRGYYLWRESALASWILADGSVVPIDPNLNAGTAGVQNFFAGLSNQAAWAQAVSPEGLYATYVEMFGYPFDLAIDPVVPADLTQPTLQLPFEKGVHWYYTGGPHGGWADGSAWAGLDFAPPGEELGCFQTDSWIVAAADGLIIHSELGAVVQDLDGDGLEQTGWTILYMHMETRDRVPVGTYLRAGEKIGHPSCEGGFSNGTHIHLARRYNGEWIPADGPLPFNLDGWISSGNGIEYDGLLTRNEQIREAWEGRFPENEILR